MAIPQGREAGGRRGRAGAVLRPVWARPGVGKECHACAVAGSHAGLMEICLRVTTRWAAFRRTDRDLAEMNRHAQAFAKAAKKLDFSAVGEANLAFHCAVAAAAGNTHFTKLMTTLLSSGLRLAQLATGQLPPGYQSHADYLA